jgi:hypothetical protein
MFHVEHLPPRLDDERADVRIGVSKYKLFHVEQFALSGGFGRLNC